ncbi:MAG: AMP-binding protein [Actinomycetota bacterium]
MVGIGERARATPDAPALITLGTTTTFGELDERQARLAGLLRAGGLHRGDRVAVYASNRPELLEVTIGALRAGIVSVPVHALLTHNEAAYIVEDSGARWLFTDGALDAPGLERIVTFGDAYERCLHEAEPEDISDLALTRPMHYTSGTTGRPKGVWVAPRSESQAALASESFRAEWGLSSEDRHLVCSPLSHSAPHRYALRTLEAGGAVVLQARFDAAETVAAIDLFGITSTFMVPTHLERIFALGGRTLLRHDLSSLRLLAHAGAPVREETKRRTIDTFGRGAVWEFYGSTEGQATRISADEWLRKPGSVGTPRAGARISILDERGRSLEAGEVGEVWVADEGAERFEYWGDAAATGGAWRDEAFTAGDLGWLDEHGYLFLTGRKGDRIISGGVNIYPQEVEDVLGEHPLVAEAMVFGAPSDEWGQEVRALVVATSEELDVDELSAWTRPRLAGYKRPRRIEVVAELPRTPTGKLQRAIPWGIAT